MEGYVKLHRAILQWEWYRDIKTKTLFIHILLRACFDKCSYKGESITRGQVITSIKKLSEETGLSSREIRTALTKLQKSNEITVEATKQYSLITVVKYEDYQIKEPVKDNRVVLAKNPVNFYDRLSKDDKWIEIVCMQNLATKASVIKALKDFDLHLISIDDQKNSIRDYKSHFVNWLRYNKDKLQKKEQNYKWKWKGQATKTGTYAEYMTDKSNFDSPGFEFQLITNE